MMRPKKSFYNKIFLIILISLLIIFGGSHSFGYEWSKTFGGNESDDEGNSVQQTTDGGFIIAGTTDPFGEDASDVYLIKTDAGGNELWSKTFGGALPDRGNSVQQTTDGGFIIAGYTESFGAGASDVYLIKTDAGGNELWSKTFGGSGSEEGNSVQQTTDGGFIIAGKSGNGYPSALLIKTNALGNELWSNTFQGDYWAIANSVQQTTDGSYIIAGYEDHRYWGMQGILWKADADGNQLWYKWIDRMKFSSVQQTTDGGYIISGGAYLIKTDALGNELWSKTFGGSEGSSVQQTADGGFIIGGSTESFGEGGRDVYLIKTDADGNELWNKTFGGNEWDEGSSVQQTTDGGFIIAGSTESFGDGGRDVYLVYYKPEFVDVPPGYWAEEAIYKIYNAGITTGCSKNPLKYCPQDDVTRAQMAVFLGRGINGSSFTPPPATGIFDDVPVDFWAADWTEQLYKDGITSGCGQNPLRFCPTNPVTRAQMAIFLLRSKHGKNYTPPQATGIFDDVPVTHWAADWIEKLYQEGITKGCGTNPPRYCPNNSVTRAQMAVFLMRTFGL